MAAGHHAAALPTRLKGRLAGSHGQQLQQPSLLPGTGHATPQPGSSAAPPHTPPTHPPPPGAQADNLLPPPPLSTWGLVSPSRPGRDGTAVLGHEDSHDATAAPDEGAAPDASNVPVATAPAAAPDASPPPTPPAPAATPSRPSSLRGITSWSLRRLRLTQQHSPPAPPEALAPLGCCCPGLTQLTVALYDPRQPDPAAGPATASRHGHAVGCGAVTTRQVPSLATPPGAEACGAGQLSLLLPLTQLHHLSLSDSCGAFLTASSPGLLAGLPLLTSLVLEGCRRVSLEDHGLAQLPSSCPGLEELQLLSCPSVTDRGLLALAGGLLCLRALRLRQLSRACTLRGVRAMLQSGLPALRELRAEQCAGMGGEQSIASLMCAVKRDGFVAIG
ncbi:hypothetical protein V8C86DRAFT_3150694 [Haematococcus lacustris]